MFLGAEKTSRGEPTTTLATNFFFFCQPCNDRPWAIFKRPIDTPLRKEIIKVNRINYSGGRSTRSKSSADKFAHT